VAFTDWNKIKMDSPELTVGLDMIQVAMTRIETAEMGIRIMTDSSLALTQSR
jgi:hypothetical protein